MDNFDKYVAISFVVCSIFTLAFVYIRDVYDPREEGRLTQLAVFIGTLVMFPIVVPALLIAELTRGWLWGRKKKNKRYEDFED